MNTISIDAEELRSRLQGELLLPDDPGYDEARPIWNAMHDRRPALIVRPRGGDDVAAAIAFAREHRLPIAIRGGGHSVAGYGTVEGGLVIDQSQLQGVEVDAERRVVRVEPGVTLADLDRATQEHGLAVPIGVVSGTGVAGLTLGGGVGWLTRAYGLTVDNLLAVELVTADGRTVRASDVEEPELFWGLRGGGGNFGVVTAFEFRAHAHGPLVHGGNLLYRRPTWTDALRAYRDWTSAGLPDAMTSIVSFLTPPPSWELGDETLLIIGFAWAGPEGDEAARVVAPLREALEADVEVLDPVAWIEWQAAADELFPKGSRAYWKNTALDALDDGAIDAIVRTAEAMAPRAAGLDVHHMGGAFARVAEDATPFPNRSAAYWVNVYGVWDAPEGDEAGRQWARDGHAALEPYAADGLYVNFMGAAEGDPDPAAAVQDTYGEAKLSRLRELKRAWDPENVFRLNHNIAPAVTG